MGKKYSTTVFLDVEGAFDTVWHDGLLFKLQSLGLPAYLLNIIASFLSDRTFQVRVNSCLSERRPMRAGVPQGAILSPLLFNIFCHDIPVNESLLTASYADDTLLMSQGSDLEFAIEQLQMGLDTVAEWFRRWGLRLNPGKTEAKTFGLRRLDTDTQTKLTLNNAQIPWKRTDEPVKYLGLHLDTKLQWNAHINKKLNAAHSRLAQLYPLLNRHSSLKHACTKTLYTGLLRPLLTYACPVWAGLTKTQLTKLQRFENKVLRLAVGAPWFVRNSQIRRELGVPEIGDFIKKTATKFKENLQNVPGALEFNIGHTLLPEDN